MKEYERKPIFKICNVCYEEKPVEDFYTNYLSCKECAKAKSRGKKNGYIYIISNPAWKGYYKIGRTVDIHSRMGSYQTSSPHRDYYLEHMSGLFDDLATVENTIYKRFSFIYEWTTAPLIDLIEFIKTLEITE